MSYPRDERNNDREDAVLRSQLRPSTERVLAIARKTEDEKISQTLVDETIQKEQVEFSVNPQVQDHPGIPEGERKMDNVEKIMATDPVRMFNPVLNPPAKSTIPSWLKKLMGVPEIRARTHYGAVPQPRGRVVVPKSPPAHGLPVVGRSMKDTPVKTLNPLDQFFNWLNAFLRGD